MPRGGGAEPHSALQTAAEEAGDSPSPARRANGRWRASLRPHGLLHDRDALVVERRPRSLKKPCLARVCAEMMRTDLR